MRIPRLYSPEPIAAQTAMQLNAEAARHAVRVLRLRPGAEVVLFDGSGTEFPATLMSVAKGSVSVQVGEEILRDLESPLEVMLVQGISRGERMDMTLQKATELGVSRIVPVTMKRTVVRLSAQRAQSRLAHWRAVVVQACQQCGRNTVPTVEPAVVFDAWLAAHVATDLDLVLTPGAAPLHVEGQPGSLTLAIGPEGGLAEQESKQLQERGFEGLALGPRILRTETAALAAIAVVQSRWGDFQA